MDCEQLRRSRVRRKLFLGVGVQSIIDMCINNLYRDVEKLAMQLSGYDACIAYDTAGGTTRSRHTSSHAARSTLSCNAIPGVMWKIEAGAPLLSTVPTSPSLEE